MQNTFFYLGACHSLENDSLWDALAAKGAKVAFGWSDTVYTSFDAQTFQTLMGAMLPTDQTPPMSALQAFNSLQTKCDDHPSPACLQMRVAEAPKAMEIITQHQANFMEWYRMHQNAPMLQSIKAMLNRIAQLHEQELNNPQTRCPYIAAEQKIQQVMNGIAGKIWPAP